MADSARKCRSCGATAQVEAKFCRQCGTPLFICKSRGGHEPEVSPQAPTIPLASSTVMSGGLPGDLPGDLPGEVVAFDPEAIDHHLPGEAPQTLRRDGHRSSDGMETEDIKKFATRELVSPITESYGQPNAEVGAATDRGTNTRRSWQAVAVLLLGLSVAAGVLAILASRSSRNETTANTSPISISDQKKLFDEQLRLARVALENLDPPGALGHLRSAARFAPHDISDNIALGDAFAAAGAREEAFDSYLSATQVGQDSSLAWSKLATAQFEAKRYGEASESYRRLIDLASGGKADGTDQGSLWLSLAEALRLSGRGEESRLAYQKAAASASSDVSRSAKARLAQLPSLVAAPERKEQNPKSAAPARVAVVERPTMKRPEPGPLSGTMPRSVPEMASRYPDMTFGEGIKVLNGRDPRQLQRADLIRALEFFQYASQKGANRIEASKYADRLGKEFDRRRK